MNGEATEDEYKGQEAGGGWPADVPPCRTEEKCSGWAVNCCNVEASTQVVIGERLKRFYGSMWRRAAQVRCQVFTGFESDI